VIAPCSRLGRMRRSGLVLVLFAGTVAAVACNRPDAAPGADSTPDGSTAAAARAGTPAAPWVDELGPMLVVPADSDNAGIVIFPENPTSRLVASAPITFLSPAGDSTAARAALVVSDSQVCGEAPTVHIDNPITLPWTVGLLGRSLRPLRMDSITALAPTDSLRLTGELARLASSLPMQRGSRFTGLPFAVFSARRFEARDRQVLVAHLIRRLAQEAAPIEEHTFLIAERAATPSSERYATVYHQRSEGSEDSAEQFEVLSAVDGRNAILLLISRDNVTQTTYEILERSNAGAWRSRWSRVLSC
jgi:hypothetical protein